MRGIDALEKAPKFNKIFDKLFLFFANTELDFVVKADRKSYELIKSMCL